MNDFGDISSTHSLTPDTKPCGLTSIIPSLKMASCRDRAEAFARSLSSKLRTLGSQSQNEDPHEEIRDGNSSSASNWLTSDESEKIITDTQPLRNESDSFFDFECECELESPGSPVDECVYLELIETASNTPHNLAAEPEYINAVSAKGNHNSSERYDQISKNPTVHKVYNEPAKIDSSSKELGTGSGNCLKVNGSLQDFERYSNGCDLKSISSTETSSGQHQNLMTTDTEQKILPDERARPEQTDSKEIKNQSLVQEMIDIQDIIISELQKQSERISESLQTCGEGRGICIAKRPDSLGAGATEQEDRDAGTINVLTNTENVASTIHQTLPPPNGDFEKAAFLTTAPPEEQELKDKDDIRLHFEARREGDVSPIKDQKLTEKDNFRQCHHSVLDTDDEDDCRPQRVRRCSSLKTGKTPPGTPSRKKIVRFADVLGLDLADVKTFLDEVPTIPKSAFEDLEILDSEPPFQFRPKSDKLLIPLFQQPASLPTFLDTVHEKQVSLENAAISDPTNQTITGSIRVRNLDFHKSAYIRYTLDGWRSFADLQANYVPNSCDGFSDKFSFVLFGNSLQIGQRLEFAVRFQCKGQQFWDNNHGMNYCFQCVPTTVPAINPNSSLVSHHTDHIIGLLSASTGEAWCNSFY